MRPTPAIRAVPGRLAAGASTRSATATRIVTLITAAALTGLAGCGAPTPAPAPPAASPPAASPPAASQAVPVSPAAPASPSAGAPASASGSPQATEPTSETPAPGGVTTPDQVFGAGCASLPAAGAPGSLTAMAGQPVAAALAGNPELTSLSTLLKKANLVDTWNSQPAATVFAPTNQAFARLRQTLGADQFAALLADQNKLADLLTYQFVAHRYDRAGLLAAQTVPTEEGGSLRIATSGATVTVTDGARRAANVLCGNIPTANATVFLLDTVPLAHQP